ncbi:hypothetical protein BDV96DRAFT_607364 [Lophiotrema nucula]|uniref:Uncharacterized protein n=1 Tax=Lophiotrema nucula TaxID=690887 RepID=A0A6A5YK12_9PLEO|nr:hypothetical protein BDV96DRAFT_607364 [Lophiotrema nucula]
MAQNVLARCWRCTLLNLSCDAGGSCLACKNAPQKKGNQIELRCCQPKKLAVDREHAFRDLVEISDTVWFFRLNNQERYEVIVDTHALGMDNAYKHAILDLPYMIQRDEDHIDESNDKNPCQAIRNFISQLVEAETRWPSLYEPLTNDIIDTSADYATSLFLYRSLDEREPEFSNHSYHGVEND